MTFQTVLLTVIPRRKYWHRRGILGSRTNNLMTCKHIQHIFPKNISHNEQYFYTIHTLAFSLLYSDCLDNVEASMSHSLWAFRAYLLQGQIHM